MIDDELTVDENVVDALGKDGGLVPRRPILNSFEVEYDDIRPHALSDQSRMDRTVRDGKKLKTAHMCD